ncbi:MAG: nuclear transport factor 2 family protein [Anaerolineae bacterium]|nr:nuclear transport factor 2 family protein [Anaerolineae bacterium]
MNPSSELPVEAQISALERQWAAAFQAKDIFALQNLMADGYALIIGVQGMPLQVVPRNAWLEDLHDYDISSVNIDHIHVRAYGDVAVAVMLWRQEAMLGGRDRSAQFMLTDIWIRQNGEWRMAERHSSRPEHPGAARPHSMDLECGAC